MDGTKFIRDADAHIAKWYSIAGVGRIGRDVDEARNPEIGVLVFDTPKDMIDEGVIDSDTGSPAIRVAAIADEWSGSEKSVRGRRIAPGPTDGAEEKEAIPGEPQPAADRTRNL